MCLIETEERGRGPRKAEPSAYYGMVFLSTYLWCWEMRKQDHHANAARFGGCLGLWLNMTLSTSCLLVLLLGTFFQIMHQSIMEKS